LWYLIVDTNYSSWELYPISDVPNLQTYDLSVNGVKMPEKILPPNVGGVTEVVPRPGGGHMAGKTYVNRLWKGAKQTYAAFHEWRHGKDLKDYPHLIDGAKILYGDASRMVIEALTEIQTRYENPGLAKEVGVKAYQNYINLFNKLAGGDLMKKVEEIKVECNEVGKRAYEAGKREYDGLKRGVPSGYSAAYSQMGFGPSCRRSGKYCC
jgi:hypothetical protein